MESLRSAENKYSAKKTGFRTIELVGKLVLALIARFWKACSLALLFIFLLYWLYGGITTVILLFAAFVGAFYHYQDALLYFPDQPENSRIFVQSARVLGVPHENLFIKTRDGVTLNAIFLKQNGKRVSVAPTILMFHGNAGNIGHRFANAQLLYTYTASNVLLLEYRGYGKSEGSPSEKGFELDSVAALEYLLSRAEIDHSKIVLNGRSLGGAVAFSLAAHKKYMDVLFAVIVENTFTSIPDMAKHLFVYLGMLPVWCYKNKFLSIEKVGGISCPTLFLSGLSDQLVPPQQMNRLYSASGGCVKRMATFESGTHNDTWTCQGYADAINNFLNEVHEARKNGVVRSTAFRKSTSDDEHSTIIDL